MDILITQGLKPEQGVIYSAGEMDVLCNGVYYEVKSNKTPQAMRKAEAQVLRAIRYGKCHSGYLSTNNPLELSNVWGWKRLQKKYR